MNKATNPTLPDTGVGFQEKLFIYLAMMKSKFNRSQSAIFNQMRKNTANVTGARNYAEMSSRRQSRGQKTNAKIRSYQNWIMTRPAEYWDEVVERRKYNALVFSDESRRNAIIAMIETRRKDEWKEEMDRMFVHMTLTLLDLLCTTEGLSHKWEFSMVADASAALFAQLKRQGGQKSAWAHKQNPVAFARRVFKTYESVFVRF